MTCPTDCHDATCGTYCSSLCPTVLSFPLSSPYYSSVLVALTFDLPSRVGICGDFKCDSGETCSSCFADCGPCGMYPLSLSLLSVLPSSSLFFFFEFSLFSFILFYFILFLMNLFQTSLNVSRRAVYMANVLQDCACVSPVGQTLPAQPTKVSIQ